jgi:hypothetical protein
MNTVILIHSPVTTPAVWEPVGAALRNRDVRVLVPDLNGDDNVDEPLWQQHIRAASVSIAGLAAGTQFILVGHSGAGPLLPAIREFVGRPTAGYIFVDAGLPENGGSQIDGPFGPQLRAIYSSGGRYPNWSDEDLREAVPDEGMRRWLLQQVRRQPLRFWREVIPVEDGWPDAPCAYLRFSLNPAYEAPASEAQRLGWAYAELPGDHFHMLVEPNAVADRLIGLSQRW